MVHPSQLNSLVSNATLSAAVVEAAIAVALQQLADSTISGEEQNAVIDYLEAGETEKAARLIENKDVENSETDLEDEVRQLCDELEGCEIPTDDPHEAKEEAERQLSLDDY